jgi:hypothetical protein
MPKLKGTIRKNDLEGGFYQLIADDGTAYELEGSDPLLSRDGAKVEVDGTVDRNAMSFTMSGPRLKVTSVKSLT